MAKTTAANYPFEFPDQSTSLDPEAFDTLIRTQGTPMVHYRALPCPIGMISADDERRPHEHHAHCSNGFIYTPSGQVTCSFQSNTKDVRETDLGRYDGSTVQVTFPRYYDDCGDQQRPVQPVPFDRMYLKDENITVVTWERHNLSEGGVDKLRYPIVCVIDLMDSKGVLYSHGTDFDIVAGKIQWKPGVTPGLDNTTEQGKVIAIRYTFRPFWYIQRMIHEVRVTQVENEFTGERTTMRFPQSMILQREQVFENEQRDKYLDKTARMPEGPASPNLPPKGSNLGVG